VSAKPLRQDLPGSAMRLVRCNLCGADDFQVIFPAGYAQLHQIVRCHRCGLMYANPQQHVDCEDYAVRQPAEVYDPASELNRQYYQKQVTQLPDNLRALAVLDTVLPGHGRLLEVGCFLGLFLDRIRAMGWQVMGLEPYRPVANYARTKFGLEIIEGVLPNPALPTSHFDAVMMLHVIEHMPDPAESLRELRRVLKHGGVLVVETPRFNSLAFKVLGRRERSIQNCPGHIFFFTEQTLQRIMESNGFRVFRIERVGRTLTTERFLVNLGLVTRCALAQLWMANTARAWHLENIRFYINVRDMQRMYARAV
jgi:SAM-dependent methyltransferase